MRFFSKKCLTWQKHCGILMKLSQDRALLGEVSEWFNELVLKTSELARAPRVRIPPSPLYNRILKTEFSLEKYPRG